MIINMIGDLLTQPNIMIRCHQVNCKGVMGAGLAKQIKNRYPECFQEYKNYCQKRQELLGNTLFVMCNDGYEIANLFAQDNYGTSKRQTDYEAFERCIQQVREKAEIENKSVGFPYKIGCGLAGGEWKVIFPLIEKHFQNTQVKCYICSLV